MTVYSNSNQMLGAIGENLTCVMLMAHGWPTANVNQSINNFKGIDLFCQKGVDSEQVIGIQVKTSAKSSFLLGFSCEEAADRDFLERHIIGPWVFVHITSLVPLEADYYVVPREALIDMLYCSHQWYLYQWDRPATPSLRQSVAAIKVCWLRGDDGKSSKSQIPFVNPYPGDIFRQPDSLDKIW